MIEKLKTVWAKFKWYIVAGLALALLLVAFLLGRRDPTKLVKAAVRAQRDLVESELKRKRAREDGNNEEISRIDERLKEVDQEVERIENEVDSMSLKELSDAWQKISL